MACIFCEAIKYLAEKKVRASIKKQGIYWTPDLVENLTKDEMQNIANRLIELIKGDE